MGPVNPILVGNSKKLVITGNLAYSGSALIKQFHTFLTPPLLILLCRQRSHFERAYFGADIGVMFHIYCVRFKLWRDYLKHRLNRSFSSLFAPPVFCIDTLSICHVFCLCCLVRCAFLTLFEWSMALHLILIFIALVISQRLKHLCIDHYEMLVVNVWGTTVRKIWNNQVGFWII